MKAATLLIALVLGTISCKRVDPHHDHLPPSQEQIERNKIKTGIDRFEIDCGRFPSTAENLSALVTRPPDIPEKQWHGPYLPSVPKDQWGHDYVYRCPGLHNPSPYYDLYSCGSDGVSQSGGDDPDDIPNWRRPDE